MTASWRASVLPKRRLPLLPVRRITFVSLLYAVLACARPALAHPVPFSYLDVQIEPSAVEVALVAHIFDLAHDLQINSSDRLLEPSLVAERQQAMKAMLEPRLRLDVDGHVVAGVWGDVEILRERQSLRFHIRYPVTSAPGTVAVDTVMFPYDPMHQTFVNIYEGETLTSQMILDGKHSHLDYFAGSKQGVFAVVKKFIPAGVHHILIGPDHLLFLVGLLLLGGSLRQLLVVVTSFTIAHSITLSLAALNIVTPPTRLIEPAIALSIVYVGADNILAKGGRDIRGWIAFTFGFIHGFGFANVLREMDLPRRALGWSLFSFNIGVEIGQLFVVVLVATAFTMLRAKSEWSRRHLAFAGSIVVIAAGAFWFVQRVFFPGGLS
jgi:hydrogenase/urease accessory protein HupE